MLHLTAGNTDDRIIVTLNEKKTIDEPTYQFVFTHITTKEVVQFNLPATAEVSSYRNRYNEFSIDTSVLFAGSTPGQWQYEINEVESGLQMENGKMFLQGSSNFAYTGYSPSVTYKGYGG